MRNEIKSIPTLKSFTKTAARPLPVIILADTSGSMEQHGKIQALNDSLRAMWASFANADVGKVELQVAVITFGSDGAQLHTPLTPVDLLKWHDLEARGKTPMGAAFQAAAAMVEDREVVSGRAYTPTLVLVSDGIPTDEWQSGLRVLKDSPRAAKAQRLALGIGDDADAEVLRAFVSDPSQRVFKASEARQIQSFFRLVTMSVTSRVMSADPSVIITEEIPDDLDLF